MIETTIIVAVIIGLVEAIKKTGFLNSKYSALVAIAFGVLWYTLGVGGDIAMNVFEGIMAGLMSAGLYSGTKATLE